MNCEKCEPLLLDELYEELDEVTSAAVQRHVEGCAACDAILEGLRATRGAVSLPLEPLPAGLEERLLGIAEEADKVVPIQGRASRAVSWAGRWAMRPQTAMAAVFLLMIGTSAFVFRSRAPGSPQEGVSVTVQGAPAPAASKASAEEGKLDDKAAAQAHGAVVPAAAPPPAVAQPVATAAAEALALKDEAPRSKAMAPSADLDDGLSKKQGEPSNAGPIAGAGGRAAGATATLGQSQTGANRDGFAAGMADYNARRFNEATQKFEGEAKSGDANAALWAARSSREGSGCASAVKRFDRVAAQAKNTPAGRNATLEAARCYRVLGNYAAARQRLATLDGTELAVAANEEKNKVETVARAADSTRGGAPAAAAAAPRRAAPAAPRKAAASPRQRLEAPQPAPKPTQADNPSAAGF